MFIKLKSTHVHGLVARYDFGVGRCEPIDGLIAGHVIDLEGHERIVDVTHVVEEPLGIASARAILAAHEIQNQLTRAGHRYSAARLVGLVQERLREVHLDTVYVRDICTDKKILFIQLIFDFIKIYMTKKLRQKNFLYSES